MCCDFGSFNGLGSDIKGFKYLITQVYVDGHIFGFRDIRRNYILHQLVELSQECDKGVIIN